MWGLVGLVLGMLLTTGTPGCSPSTLSDNQAVQISARTITATEKENGRRLALHPDDILTLRLQSIPGTGYSWQISKNDARVMKPLDKPEYERQDKKAMGSVAYQIFRLKALAKGTDVLELQYKRVWEKEKKPLKTFRVTVQID
jgi:predicted secreted protein